MHTQSSVLAVEPSGAALDAFNREPERAIEGHGRRVRREHLELHALDPQAPGRRDRVCGQASAEPLAPIDRKKSHAQRADVPEPLVRVANDVAPADDRLCGGDGQHLDTRAGEDTADELAANCRHIAAQWTRQRHRSRQAQNILRNWPWQRRNRS